MTTAEKIAEIMAASIAGLNLALEASRLLNTGDSAAADKLLDESRAEWTAAADKWANR
jgi:hypothetical protein